MKTVLITGAAGFLGFHLCQKFLSQGYDVIAVDNFCTGSRSHKELLEKHSFAERTVFFAEADVSLPWDNWVKEIPTNLLKNLHYVLHFASPASPAHYAKLTLETLAVNSTGLSHALNFADPLKARVVFSSTSEVYGSSDKKRQSEDSWGVVNSFGERSCYQEAKRFGESLIFSHNRRFNTRHGLVRIFNTYGPHMNPEDGRVIINFLMQAQRKEALTVFGNGSQTRSFCYVDDLVEGIYRYTHSSFAEPVNLGNPEELTVLELAKLVSGLYSEHTPQIIFKDLPAEDPEQRCPDISKAQKILDDWKPQISLPEGLLRMKSWYET